MPLKQAASLLLPAAALGATGFAQDSPFRTPGMPTSSSSGQTDRFSSEFNPAIGLAIDSILDYIDPDDSAADDGFDASVRLLEMVINGRIDPSWWGYAAIAYADEEVELEEAAVFYQGIDSNTSFRFGRFFADFGKQMQAHVHDLPYPDRPGVLAEYLGEELPGTGAQVDHWWATGDSSALRASVGVFTEFEVGHGHGEEGGEEGAEVEFAERKDADDFALTVRITQFMDVGDTGVFQWGVSARHLSDFAFVDEENDLTADELSNTVVGLDLTYGLDSEDGLSGWTFGGEYLHYTGDINAEANGGMTALDVLDEDVGGFYLWGERRFDARNSAGVLFSQFEHPEADRPEDTEITAYYTRHMSEFARLRFALSQLDSDEEGESTRFLIQLTNFVGPHSHGVNW